MSKSPAQFPKPRDLANSFVDRGSSALHAEESEPEPPEVAPPALTRPPEEPKATSSYKHRVLSAKRLRLASQKLGIPQGELLDQAIDAMWPKWKSSFPPDPQLD